MKKLQTITNVKLGGRLSKVVFKNSREWFWSGRPERFHQSHIVDMDGWKARYELF